MADYSLRCSGSQDIGAEEIHFSALSFDGALNLAKKHLNGRQAVLLEDGRPICSMQMVSETGAWLIGRPPLDNGS
ncbi:hypothetical protein [Erythrobacter litoralis]|nr:hypothetical protein [Erythrobacter litoralis]